MDSKYAYIHAIGCTNDINRKCEASYKLNKILLPCDGHSTSYRYGKTTQRHQKFKEGEHTSESRSPLTKTCPLSNIRPGKF